MIARLTATLLAVLAALLPAAAAGAAPMRLEEIEMLLREGVSQSVILGQVRATGTRLGLTALEILRLWKEGAGDDLVLEIIGQGPSADAAGQPPSGTGAAAPPRAPEGLSYMPSESAPGAYAPPAWGLQAASEAPRRPAPTSPAPTTEYLVPTFETVTWPLNWYPPRPYSRGCAGSAAPPWGGARPWERPSGRPAYPWPSPVGPGTLPWPPHSPIQGSTTFHFAGVATHGSFGDGVKRAGFSAPRASSDHPSGVHQVGGGFSRGRR